MKTATAIRAIIAATVCHTAPATVIITGDGIKIGATNTLSGDYSGIIGHSNYVNQPYSLAIGAFNDLNQNDNDFGSFALGHHNYIHGYGSMVGGSYNSVLDDSSITIGFYNYNNARASLVVGQGNVLEYFPHKNAIVAGEYNAAIPSGKPAHLVIGNGTSSTDRNNSLVVYADGDIVITKPQGDISMGIYGN